MTLDFNGFTLTGNPSGRFGVFDGFEDRARVTVRNGVVTSFAGAIELFSTTNVDLRDMRIQNDGPQSNVVLTGPGAIVMNNIIDGGNFSLLAGLNSIISGNVVKNAKKVGITAFCPSTVTGNTVESLERAITLAFDEAKCAAANNSILSTTGGN